MNLLKEKEKALNENYVDGSPDWLFSCSNSNLIGCYVKLQKEIISHSYIDIKRERNILYI